VISAELIIKDTYFDHKLFMLNIGIIKVSLATGWHRCHVVILLYLQFVKEFFL
jgi:hypothetical protein